MRREGVLGPSYEAEFCTCLYCMRKNHGRFYSLKAYFWYPILNQLYVYVF